MKLGNMPNLTKVGILLVMVVTKMLVINNMKIFSTSGTLIYEDDSKTIKETVQNAVKNNISLSRTNLSCENLRYIDLSYADLSYANLRYIDLTSANLTYANLSCADLSNAKLSNANLTSANLTYANLRYTDLTYTDLSYADLSYANLRYTDLTYADLSNANLTYADLSYADLSYADLSDANLSNTDLSNANLSNANIDRLIYKRTILPEGDLIVYKKLENSTVCKLLIPKDAKRVGGVVGRKCRAEYAIVLEGEGCSLYEPAVCYKPGLKMIPDSFNDNPLIECSHGIHFFITRQEAEEYTQ